MQVKFWVFSSALRHLKKTCPKKFCCNGSLLCWWIRMWPKLLYADPAEFYFRRRTGIDLGSMWTLVRIFGIATDSIITLRSNTLHCGYSLTFLALLVRVWGSKDGNVGLVSNPVILSGFKDQHGFWRLVVGLIFQSSVYHYKTTSVATFSYSLSQGVFVLNHEFAVRIQHYWQCWRCVLTKKYNDKQPASWSIFIKSFFSVKVFKIFFNHP